MTQVAVIGAGPGGYEAALVAASLGADVTVIAAEGAGGSCVLYDCVPSKTLIATSDKVTSFRNAAGVGLQGTFSDVDLHAVNDRITALAQSQSDDIAARLVREGVNIVTGHGRFAVSPSNGHRHSLEVVDDSGSVVHRVEADVVLVATGGTPRELAGSPPDGERILSWRQLYDLDRLPEELVVIGSGVTGAEFASGYCELGVPVTLVSSRDRVLPSEDADAAAVIERVFTEGGGRLVKQARAKSVSRDGGSVVVELVDGRVVRGSHALICVGTVPNTASLGLAEAGVEVDREGYIVVDRVSRTSVPGVYAAGDCTGVMLLASVAAMQGRIAMWHALGEAVAPLRTKTVAANVFTHPEIATVGIGAAARATVVPAAVVTLPLSTNARAKMQNNLDGFVKLYARQETGVVVGGVVVAPDASELIMPVTLAVQRRLTVDDLAATFTVYPSLSGSIAEAARRLMHHGDLD